MERELLQFETADGEAVVVELVDTEAAFDPEGPEPHRPVRPGGARPPGPGDPGGRDLAGVPATAERAYRAGEVLVSKIRLDDALSVVRTTADAVVGQVRDLARPPDKVEVEFGLQLSSKVGAVIAAGEAKAHLKLKLTWQPTPAPPPPRGV